MILSFGISHLSSTGALPLAPSRFNFLIWDIPEATQILARRSDASAVMSEILVRYPSSTWQSPLSVHLTDCRSKYPSWCVPATTSPLRILAICRIPSNPNGRPSIRNSRGRNTCFFRSNKNRPASAPTQSPPLVSSDIAKTSPIAFSEAFFGFTFSNTSKPIPLNRLIPLDVPIQIKS